MAKPIVEKGRMLVAELNTVLEAFAAERGLKVESSNDFSYTPNSIHISKIIFHVPQAGESVDSVLTEEQKNYDAYRGMYKLPARDTKFWSEGVNFRIVGWASRSKKYPIVAINLSNNTRYKFSVESIIRCCK